MTPSSGDDVPTQLAALLGKAAIYIEQNHRPQLFYTDEDRELIDEAWALAAAHREDLVGRRQGAPPRVALRDGPSVMAMLQSGERE